MPQILNAAHMSSAYQQVNIDHCCTQELGGELVEQTGNLPLVLAVADFTVIPLTVTGGMYSKAPLASPKADSSSSPVCCSSALQYMDNWLY